MFLRKIREGKSRVLAVLLSVVMAAMLVLGVSGQTRGAVALAEAETKTSGYAEATLSLDASVAMLLSSLLGTDINWFESVTASVEFAASEEAAETLLALSLNGETLLSADALLDLSELFFYLSIPEASQAWLGLDLMELLGISEEDLSELVAAAELLEELGLDEELLEEVLGAAALMGERYLSLITDNITDIEESAVVLSIGSVSQECTGVTMNITAGDIANKWEDIQTEAANDAELLEIVQVLLILVLEELDCDTRALAAMDFRAEFEELLTELDVVIEDLRRIDDEEAIQITIWYDEDGEVIGYEVAYAYGEEQEELIWCGLVQDGEEFACVYDLLGELFVSGSGTSCDGLLEAVFDVSLAVLDEQTYEYEPMTVLTMTVKQLDLESLEKGYLCGVLELSLGADLAESYGASGLAADALLRLSLDQTKESSELEIAIVYGELELVALTLYCEYESDLQVMLLAVIDVCFDMTSEEGLIEYATTVDWLALADIVQSCDIPAEYTGELVELLEQMAKYF